MTKIPDDIWNAVTDAERGHRITEWEDVAQRLASAVKEHFRLEASAEAPKSLEDMQAEVTSWCERKGWKGEGSAPVTFGDTMALLHSEVSEALEAYRDWGLNDATGKREVAPHAYMCDFIQKPLDKSARCTCEFGETAKPEGVGSEFADILIRLLDDCDRWGVDLRAEYERKMAYNERRPYQHGGRIL